jgi:hypothetical protein
MKSATKLMATKLLMCLDKNSYPFVCRWAKVHCDLDKWKTLHVCRIIECTSHLLYVLFDKMSENFEKLIIWII